MPQTSRRKFLGCSCSLLVAPFLPAQPLVEGKSLAAAPLVEPEWREPGQTKDSDYLQKAALRYSAEGRAIVGRNRTCFNNRPLYCEPGTEGVVLAGDRPFVRLLAKPYVLGGFAAAIVRRGSGKWFHDFSEVESRYRCGRMSWRINDSALAGVLVELDAVPLQGAAGICVTIPGRGLKGGRSDGVGFRWRQRRRRCSVAMGSYHAAEPERLQAGGRSSQAGNEPGPGP